MIKRGKKLNYKLYKGKEQIGAIKKKTTGAYRLTLFGKNITDYNKIVIILGLKETSCDRRKYGTKMLRDKKTDEYAATAFLNYEGNVVVWFNKNHMSFYVVQELCHKLKWKKETSHDDRI